MDATHRIKKAAATLMVGFLLAIAFAASAQAGSGTTQGMTQQQWNAAKARAQAINRYYHLGRYSPQAQALQAEKRKYEAVDRYYHLGRYAVVSASSPFDWADVGIGVGAAVGTLLLAGGLTALAFRRRTITKSPFTSPTA